MFPLDVFFNTKRAQLYKIARLSAQVIVLCWQWPCSRSSMLHKKPREYTCSQFNIGAAYAVQIEFGYQVDKIYSLLMSLYVLQEQWTDYKTVGKVTVQWDSWKKASWLQDVVRQIF